MSNLLKTSFLFLLIVASMQSMAQEQTNDNDEEVKVFNKKGFSAGLYVGAYFPNKFSAAIYDGYGYDVDGNRNGYYTSFMYNKVVLEFGGGYGQTDYVAQALGVAPGEWTFNESDMPTNMHYNTAVLVGLNIRYSVDKRNSILINLNGSKITANGNFTISTTNNAAPIGTIPRNIHTFGIRGLEQRLLLQFGYQHLFGQDEKIHFLMEGGLNATISKFDQNDILINNLHIDLTSSYYVAGNNAYVIRKPRGTGYGAFGGIGVNLSADKRWRVQILYSPTLENINMGENPKLKFQHGFGLRAYGNF